MAAANSPRSPDGLRAILRGKFSAALTTGDVAPSERVSEIAASVEAAVAEKFGAGTKEYTSKGRSLEFNLKKNAQLRSQLLVGDLSVAWLVSASVADLATDALKLQRRESTDRYYAQRSLGASDEQVTGWNAGTTGKLEWSHKYEKEKSASAAAAASAPRDDDGPGEQAEEELQAEEEQAEEEQAEEEQAEEEEEEAGGDAAEEDTEEEEDDEGYVPEIAERYAHFPRSSSRALDEGAESGLAEGEGMEDVEADELKAAESDEPLEPDDDDDDDDGSVLTRTTHRASPRPVLLVIILVACAFSLSLCSLAEPH